MFASRLDDPRIIAFSAHLLYQRCRLKLNQTEFAALFGLTQPQVSQLEQGKAEPTPQFVFAIEQALALDPGTLSKHLGYAPVGSNNE